MKKERDYTPEEAKALCERLLFLTQEMVRLNINAQEAMEKKQEMKQITELRAEAFRESQEIVAKTQNNPFLTREFDAFQKDREIFKKLSDLVETCNKCFKEWIKADGKEKGELFKKKSAADANFEKEFKILIGANIRKNRRLYKWVAECEKKYLLGHVDGYIFHFMSMDNEFNQNRKRWAEIYRDGHKALNITVTEFDICGNLLKKDLDKGWIPKGVEESGIVKLHQKFTSAMLQTTDELKMGKLTTAIFAIEEAVMALRKREEKRKAEEGRKAQERVAQHAQPPVLAQTLDETLAIGASKEEDVEDLAQEEILDPLATSLPSENVSELPPQLGDTPPASSKAPVVASENGGNGSSAQPSESTLAASEASPVAPATDKSAESAAVTPAAKEPVESGSKKSHSNNKKKHE